MRFIRKVLYSLLFLALSPPTNASASGWLYTSGGRIHNPDRTLWVAHGVNLADMRHNSQCWLVTDANETIRRLDIVAEWGANLIRIPLETWDNEAVSPGTSDIISQPAYLASIKAIVDHATVHYPNMYLMLTPWHDPTFNTNSEPTAATDAVYQKLVDTFHSYPNVIFGVDNEPLLQHDNATVWSSMNHAVQTLRDRETFYGASPHLISVQARQWTADVSYYVANPITAGGGINIVYEPHIYDFKYTDSALTAAQSIPVIIGEYGPGDPNADKGYDWATPDYTAVNNNLTLPQVASFVQRCRELYIPVIAWAFNECDSPSMIYPSNGRVCGHACNTNVAFSVTSWGKLVKDDLATPYGLSAQGSDEGADPSLSSMSAMPSSVQANSVSQAKLTVQLLQSTGTPASGQTVLFSSNDANDSFTPKYGTTDGNGRLDTYVRSKSPGSKIITASFGQYFVLANILFAAVEPNVVTVAGSEQGVRADSRSPVQISVSIIDGSGNPVQGDFEVSTAGDGTVLTLQASTDASGQANGWMVSSLSGRKTVTASFGEDKGSTFIDFQSYYTPTVSANPNSAAADGQSKIWFDAYVTDDQNNPGANQNIYMTCSSGILGSAPSATSDIYGRASFWATSSAVRSGTCQFWGDGGTAYDRGSIVSVSFVSPGKSLYAVPPRASSYSTVGNKKAAQVTSSSLD